MSVECNEHLKQALVVTKSNSPSLSKDYKRQLSGCPSNDNGLYVFRQGSNIKSLRLPPSEYCVCSMYQISHMTSLLTLPNYCVSIQLGSSSQTHEVIKVNIPIGCIVCEWDCVVYKVVANCN